MELIDGNLVSRKILSELAEEVARLSGIPKVVFIRVGNHPASISYLNKKQKVASEVGIRSELLAFSEDVEEQALLAQIDLLNAEKSVHGILVQAPLPSHLSEQTVFNRVSPLKDVDGFNVINIGKLFQEDSAGFVPCTPLGIAELLEQSEVNIEGKHIVILGRSLIVGKPTALLLMQRAKKRNATVTICHSKTENLFELTRMADVVVAAMGKPLFLKGNMIKKGAVVIDVGINRVPDASKSTGYKLVGDVDFNDVTPIASKMTPVPGGVGPMTVTMLMRNTLRAYYLNN